MKEADEAILKKFKAWAQDRSCLQCMHWEELKETCKLFNERPPAKVIVNGCQHHDFIPF
jgi:hypothetical protein